MPMLIDTSGDQIVDETPLVPLEEWTEGLNQGIVLAVDTEPNDALAKAPVIAIDFPAFTDGRGLSLAVLLRDRYGFSGDLRAIGDVQPDMLHYLVRCGFSSFEIPEGRSVETAKAAFTPYSDYYQVATANHKRPN